jgi:hypothetical protein
MTNPDTNDARARVLARIDREQAFWRDLVEEVGVDRMTEPGPMGEWTFKDLAAHLFGWRERTLARLQAARDGRPDPPTPWPAELDGDDPINDWIQERSRGRSVDEVLADMDRSFDRLAQMVAALPDDILTRPAALPWLGDEAIDEVDFFGHLHDEHMPSVQAWLDMRRPAPA